MCAGLLSAGRFASRLRDLASPAPRKEVFHSSGAVAGGVRVRAVRHDPRCVSRGCYPAGFCCLMRYAVLMRHRFVRSGLARLLRWLGETSEHHAQSSRLRGWLNSGSNCPPCEDDECSVRLVKSVGLSGALSPGSARNQSWLIAAHAAKTQAMRLAPPRADARSSLTEVARP